MRSEYHVTITRYPWKDVLYDVTWSELNETVLVTASGDGSITLFNFLHEVGKG